MRRHYATDGRDHGAAGTRRVVTCPRPRERPDPPMSGEHFIPFRRRDVVSLCANELPETERRSFLGFTKLLTSLLHYEFQARIEALKDAYQPVNPDTDTRVVATLSAEERRAAQHRLEEELAALAIAANFTAIEPAELGQAFSEHSLLKVSLAVDLDAIDKVMFFRRGESVRTKEVPTWFGLRKRTVVFTN